MIYFLNKYLFVFIVACLLPLGIQALSSLGYLVQSSLPEEGFYAFNQVFGFMFIFITVFGSFGLFYCLGRSFGVRVDRSNVLALFFGFLVGNLVWVSVLPGFSGSPILNFVGYFIVTVFNWVFSLFFFPSFAGLLLAEFMTKKT